MVENLDPEEKNEALKRSIDELSNIAVNNVMLEDAFEIFQKKPRKRTISAKGYRLYCNLWLKFCAFVRDNFPEVKYLSEITETIAERFLYSEWEKGITERTYNERITKFRSMFSALSYDAGLRKNIWKSIGKMSEGHVSKKPFSKSQLDAIFSAASGSMRTLCMIGLYTGLRLGDAATLKWEEINFERSLISRLPNKTRRLMKNVEIPLLGGLREELLEVKKRTPEGEKYVVPDIAAQYLASDASLSLTFQNFLRSVGITTGSEREGAVRKSTVYGFHSFRHSFVSLCAAHGIPMNVVMELVGHRSAAVHEIYQHATSEEKIKAINVIEDEFRNIGS